MPSFREAFPPNGPKAQDCHPPMIVEIKSVGFEDIGIGTEVKRKPVIRFVDSEKGCVLNITNGNLLEARLGTDDTDEWVGGRICLGSVKVQFKDKLVDAIRVQPVPTRKSRPASARRLHPGRRRPRSARPRHGRSGLVEVPCLTEVAPPTGGPCRTRRDAAKFRLPRSRPAPGAG